MRQHPAGLTRQHPQQVELGRCEMHLVPAAIDEVAPQINSHVTGGELFGHPDPFPAQHHRNRARSSAMPKGLVR